MNVSSEKISHWCRAMKALAPDPELYEVNEVDLDARVQAMQKEIMARIHIGEDPDDKALHDTVKSNVASQPLEMSEDGNDLVLLGDSRFLTARVPDETENLMKVLTALKKINPAKNPESKEDSMDSDGHEDMNRSAGADSDSDSPSTPKSSDQEQTDPGRKGGYTMDDSDASDHEPNIHVKTGTTPLSMFAENRDLWYGQYPQIFLLGRGLNSKKTKKLEKEEGSEDSDSKFKVKKYFGPLQMEENLHLLYQANTMCAKNPFMVFHMFDFMSIASVLSQSAARVKQNPGSMDTVLAMVNSIDEDFGQLITRCEQNMDSAETKRVVALVMKHMVIVGSTTPFSAMQRDQTRGTLLGSDKCFASSTAFVTNAPDVDYSAMMFRNSLPSYNNLQFPATAYFTPQSSNAAQSEMAHEVMYDTLRCGSEKKTLTLQYAGVGTRTIKIRPSDIYTAASENPVAAVTFFKLNQDAMIKHILASPVQSSRHITIPLSARNKGIAGVPTLSTGVVEAQGRGTLHGHNLTKAGIPPKVLQFIAQCPALVHEAAVVLDSMQTAELDQDMHLTVIKRKSRNERAGYMGFTTSAPYVERSKGDRAHIAEVKAQEAVLRAKIIVDMQSETPTLMWGILPFVSTTLGIEHSDAALLSTAFRKVSPVDPMEEQNLDDHSWDKLVQHMRASQDPAQTALLHEVQSELLAEPSGTIISVALFDRMLLLFPDVLGVLQSKLKNFLSIKVVYGYKKGMGFRCRVSHIAGGGNFHDHKATCHKGPSGAYHCRMAIPNGLSVTTMAVQIFFNDKNKTPKCQQQWKYIPGYDPEASTPINPVLPAPPRVSARSSAFFRSPISNVDTRMLYYENRRPKLPPLSIEEIEAIKAELRVYTRKTQTAEAKAAPKTWVSPHETKILKEIEGWERRNGYLVCFNDCFQALVPGNQSINMLGSMVQSQLVSFYLASYFAKDRVAPAAIIPLISSAFRKIQKYPSKQTRPPFPTGSFERTTLHFLQTCTLSWAKHAEISAQQAAGAILNLQSDWISERAMKIYIGVAINHVVKRLPKPIYTIDPYHDSRIPYQPGQGHENTASHPSNSDVIDPDGPMPSTEIRSANGKALILLQQDMFAHRGLALEKMDYITYHCIIQAVLKNKKDCPGEDAHGKSPNQTFPFHPDYAHAAEYLQQIKTIQAFPMLVPFAPSAPPPMPSILTHAWKRSASDFSEFVMTCFTPWNLKTGIPLSVSYDSCVQFLRYLTESNSIIDQATEELIRNLTTSQTILKETKQAHQGFHHRCSTNWTEEERKMHHTNEPAADESKLTAQQQADLIDSLAAIAGLNEKQNDKSKAISDFMLTAKQKFELVMQNHDTLPPPVLPAPFTKHKSKLFKVIDPIPVPQAQLLYQAIRTKEIGDRSKDASPPLGSKVFAERFRKMKEDPSKRPNAEQQHIIDKYIHYFDELLAFRAKNLEPSFASNPQSLQPPPTPPLIFIHAEGGAGKSFIATFLQCAADSYGFGHLSTAVMGVACNNLGNAVTIDSILRPRRPYQKKKQESEENQGYANSHLPKLALLSPPLTLKMQQQIKGRALLIIDELSVFGPGTFALLDEHLRDILNDQRPFGGMAVLLLGDFFQLSAFLSRSFITVMIRNYVTHPDNRTDIELPEHQGCELLRLFTYAVLRINNRCKEPDRLEAIRRLRDPVQKPPINRAVLNLLTVMARKHIIAIPAFRFGPMLMPGNQERCMWNYYQMFFYAKANKKPIVGWKNLINGFGLWHPEIVEPLYANKESELWSYFIEGGPGSILFNYSVPLGLSNGAPIHYHGLILGPHFTAAEIKSFKIEYAKAAPGIVIILPHPPYSVNIHKEVRDEDAHLWSKENTIFSDLESKHKWVIVPLAQSTFPVSFTVAPNVSRLTYSAIRLTFAFAKTIHKCQSRTENQVIFDCNQRPLGLMPLSLRGFFVAFTRVRQGSDLLIFPGDLTYLTKLQHDPQLVHWLAGFQEGKVWDVQAVISSYLQDSGDHSKSAKRTRTSYTERVKQAVASGSFTPAALLRVSKTERAVEKRARLLKATHGREKYSMADSDTDLVKTAPKKDIQKRSERYSWNDEEIEKEAAPPTPPTIPAPPAPQAAPEFQLQYPHTLPNRGNTCFSCPPLLSLACIPEVVVALTNLRFQVQADDFVSTIGLHLQQLIPAIANRTAQPSCSINSALLELLDAFIAVVTPRCDPGWRPLQMADAADIFRIILESFPSIQELFAFDVLETLSCECQKDEASMNRIYQYVCTPMLVINPGPNIDIDAETAANQVLWTQNMTNLAIDLQENTVETARRRAHAGGPLCLRCLPGQQNPTGDFYSACKCPLHGPKQKKHTWETAASYYPVPKCFPSYAIEIASPEMEASVSYQILSQITEVESADSILCQHCNQVGGSTHRRMIRSPPPRYFMVTIKQKLNTARDGPHSSPLIEFDRLDLQALFSAQHAPSCFYSLHAATIFQNRHYTLYLPGTEPGCGVYINDGTSAPATEATVDLVSRFARVLIYKKISPLPCDIPRNPPAVSHGKRKAYSKPSTLLITSAFHKEIKRIDAILREDSLLSAIHALFDDDAQTGGEYWASHIHAGSTPAMRLCDNNITANQLRQLIQVRPAAEEGQDAWLNSELLDTVLSLFLIAKGSSLTVNEHRLQHKVLTHNNVEIRVFGCDFSKWICMHTVTSQMLKRRLKPDIIAADEQLWCPAHIASQKTSTQQGFGCHYVVIKSNLALRQSTSSDSLRDNGSFAGTIQWLANRISQIPDLLLHRSKTVSAPAWSFPSPPEQNHVEQANSSDCALHVIGDLAETLFGIPLSLRTVTRLRQNLPTLLIAFYQSQRGHSLLPPLHLEESMGDALPVYKSPSHNARQDHIALINMDLTAEVTGEGPIRPDPSTRPTAPEPEASINHPSPLAIIADSPFIPPAELFHATFLKQISYMVDILDRFKVFEISVHYLPSPKPMALFRGSADVRDAGYFFNIEAGLGHPLGPFRTIETILKASLLYLKLHHIASPVQRKKYSPLPQHIIAHNRKVRLNASLTSSERNSKMLRPDFHPYTAHYSSTHPWNGLGLTNIQLAHFIKKKKGKPTYLYPLADACESSILWNDSRGNRPGWMTNTYNHHTRNKSKGPVLSSQVVDLFYRSKSN
uniref:ATP-dependent DNA helicase n=1 Tax=Cryptomonas curvata TaxID=233186 RepID=A0A7S0QIJ3_9CRYP